VVDTSAAKPAVVDTTVVKPAYAEPSSFSAPASAVQVTADIPATKPSRNDMAALKAEFVEALAETPEPDSVQAATAWLPSRVPSEKPAVKKAAAEVSARRTATTDAPAQRRMAVASYRGRDSGAHRDRGRRGDRVARIQARRANQRHVVRADEPAGRRGVCRRRRSREYTSPPLARHRFAHSGAARARC